MNNYIYLLLILCFSFRILTFLGILAGQAEDVSGLFSDEGLLVYQYDFYKYYK